MANKHEKISSNTGASLFMNLVRNNSVALLFIIPKLRKSENSAVIDRWNYPVKKFELQNDEFLKLTFKKEIHSTKSSEDSPCSELDEEFYYEVDLSSSYINNMENPYILDRRRPWLRGKCSQTNGQTPRLITPSTSLSHLLSGYRTLGVIW